MIQVFIVICSYLLGSVPFGYLIARTKQIDIRTVGSGNIGTTNVYRALGIWYSILVGIGDVGKGVLPPLFALLLFHNQILIVFCALACVIGHIFPFYLHFKGGKGVATFAGTLIVIMGIKLFFILFLIWICCLYAIKIMSLTNLICTLLSSFFLFLGVHSLLYACYSIFITGIIWWAHRTNIERLIKGTEKKLILKYPFQGNLKMFFLRLRVKK